MATATASAAPSREDFAAMLEESFTQGGTRRKGPSSRASSSASKRTSPSSTSAPRPKGAWRCGSSPGRAGRTS